MFVCSWCVVGVMFVCSWCVVDVMFVCSWCVVRVMLCAAGVSVMSCLFAAGVSLVSRCVQLMLLVFLATTLPMFICMKRDMIHISQAAVSST